MESGNKLEFVGRSNRGGERGGIGVHPRLDVRVEVGVRALLIEGGDADLNVGSLCGFEDDVGVPRVAREDRHTERLGGSLGDDLCGSLSRDRGEEDVAALILSIGDVGGVVRGALREFLNDAVLLAEGFDEVVAQTLQLSSPLHFRAIFHCAR